MSWRGGRNQSRSGMAGARRVSPVCTGMVPRVSGFCMTVDTGETSVAGD